MAKKVILYSLQTFSTTGGIQKMTRTMAHALHTLSQKKNWDFELWSAYDSDTDLISKYLPAQNFRGFALNRIRFILKTIKVAKENDVVILSHINLALIGFLIKVLNPRCKLLLIAHGIEVWRPLSIIKNRFLGLCDTIICVSNFTRDQMISWHKTNPGKCIVLNNAIDSMMILPQQFLKPNYLIERYKLTTANKVIFSLTRLASTEQYKGHDQVIKVISHLKKEFPEIKYILSGKYDLKEEIRIKELITEYKVENEVILTGFISEEELSDHFLLADQFVLPSKKEGFGIVFIEALACGLPVICGNADGSIDAIRNGELGVAINVDEIDELRIVLAGQLKKTLSEEQRQLLQKKCLFYFNEIDYMNKLKNLIE